MAINLDAELINEPVIKDLNLLTAKPQIYLLNGAPEDVSEELKAKIKSLQADYLISDLADQNVNELIKKAYGNARANQFF